MRIIQSKNIFMKFFWIALLIFSFSYCVFSIRNTLAGYYNYDVVTQSKRVESDSLVFPALFFCIEKNVYIPNNVSSITDIFLEAWFKKSLSIFLNSFENFSNTKYSCLRFNGYRDESIKLEKNSADITDSLTIAFIVPNYSSYLSVFVLDNYPKYIGNSREIFIQSTAIIYIHKVVYKKIENPFNDCEIIEDKKYRYINCENDCINRLVNDEYNCSLGDFYGKSHKKNCDVSFVIPRRLYSECSTECPKECTQELYELDYQDYNSEKLPDGSKLLYIASSFSDLGYQENYEIPKTTSSDVLSQIGGHLGKYYSNLVLIHIHIIDFYLVFLIFEGLFLGMSLISFVELLQFLFKIIFRQCKFTTNSINYT